MNFIVNQTITIHHLSVEGMTNSSVLQVGSSGLVKPVSHVYNTGGFTEPAPEAIPLEPLVPLPPPAEG